MRPSFFRLIKATASRWNDYNAPRLGAALAYYALLSIAPLALILVGICGAVLDKSSAEAQILAQIDALAGYSVAMTFKSLVENAHRAENGIVATAIAVVMLLFGASGVFVELRDSLNTIWDAPKKVSDVWRDLLWQRLESFAMVIGLGIVLLASLLLSTGLTFFEKFFTYLVPLHAAIIIHVANLFFSVVASSLLFAAIFKFVPAVPIDWRDVTVGAAATAGMFELGKLVLAFYLGIAGFTSSYGAAGSLVAFVVWVYYSAQIFLFGAIFTRVYADTLGSHHKGIVSRAAQEAGGRAIPDVDACPGAVQKASEGGFALN